MANAAVILVLGYHSDRIGSKTVFLLALGLFTLGSALCAFAPSVPALTAFGVFQGVRLGESVSTYWVSQLRPWDSHLRGACVSQLFWGSLPCDPLFLPQIAVKTTSTFYHDSRFLRTLVRKSSSRTQERGTGFEPATSTLGKLRSAD